MKKISLEIVYRVISTAYTENSTSADISTLITVLWILPIIFHSHQEIYICYSHISVVIEIAGTSIGSGVLEAIKVLRGSGPSHMQKRGGTILVLSDGLEHNKPKLGDEGVIAKVSPVTSSY